MIYLVMYKHLTISSKQLIDTAGNEVWGLLMPPLISCRTRIDAAGTYKVKILVAVEIFQGNTIYVSACILYVRV